MKKNETKKKKVKGAEATQTPVEAPSEKKGIKIAKKILNIVINVLIVVVLVVSILIATMALTSKKNGISTVFGRTVQTIQSDSMMGGSPDGYEGGDFKTGDLVLGWSTGFDEYAEYEIGDVVTFKAYDTDGKVELVVHRIVDKVKNDSGYYVYQTWGDNREVSKVPDQLSVDNYIPAYEIGSVVYSKEHSTTVWRGFGGFLDYVRTSQGFFFIVLLPMIIFFLYELIRVLINFMGYKKAKEEENKEKAVQEAVAAALAEKDAAIGSPADMTPEQVEQFKKFLEQQNAQKAEEEASPEADSEEKPEAQEDTGNKE